MQGKHLAYRPDIDGLRAVAVLAVTIFHFNKQWMPGGFIGVDIFFVISGFLITGIIYGKGDGFSFADFYGRRVRRILPAAIFVTAITLVAGSLLMMPSDVKDLSGSAIAAALSAANVYFWLFLDTSYFAQSSETVPLLHMWSLGVEEQFYLVWPALMIIAMKLGGKRLLATAAVIIAIASFAVSEYYVTRDPSFAYYMLPSRAGELLVGALLFLWLDLRRISSAVANAAGIFGVALIAGSLAVLDETGGFPGVRSIVPAVGAALLILGGSDKSGLLAKALANPVARAIGLRSFSLYLWHWPVLAFYRYGLRRAKLGWRHRLCRCHAAAYRDHLPTDRNTIPYLLASLADDQGSTDICYQRRRDGAWVCLDPDQRLFTNRRSVDLQKRADPALLQYQVR
ncbi:acyltransferase [Pseudomonas putida]|nr:acyltransferase [Pseudomonas putida]